MKIKRGHLCGQIHWFFHSANTLPGTHRVLGCRQYKEVVCHLPELTVYEGRGAFTKQSHKHALHTVRCVLGKYRVP